MHEIKRLIKIWLAMSPVAIIKFIRPRSITLENKEIFISKYSQISTHALIAKSATDPPSLPPPLLPTNLPDNLIYSSLQLPFPPPSRDQPLTSVTFWGKIGVFFLIKFILRIKYWNSTRIMLAQHNSLQSSFFSLYFTILLSPLYFHLLPSFFMTSPIFPFFSSWVPPSPVFLFPPSLPPPSLFPSSSYTLYFISPLRSFSLPSPILHLSLSPFSPPSLLPLQQVLLQQQSRNMLAADVGTWLLQLDGCLIRRTEGLKWINSTQHFRQNIQLKMISAPNSTVFLA